MGKRTSGELDAMNGVIGFPHSTDGSCFRVPFGVWRFVGVRPWRDISKARTECHFTPCMDETLSSPFLDPLLFRLSFHLVAVRCSPPISSHLQSCKSLLSEPMSGHVQNRDRGAESCRRAEMGHAVGRVLGTALNRARLQESSSGRPVRPGRARDPGAENCPNVEGD